MHWEFRPCGEQKGGEIIEESQFYQAVIITGCGGKNRLLRISEPLRKAYELKQQFELVKASKDREEAARRLSKWIFRAQQSGLPDFIKVSFTYQNWSKEILNSF